MNPFEYASPNSIEDAVAMLSDRWGQSEILAGGTDLLTVLKQNLTRPRRLVSLKAVRELNGVDKRDDQVAIGAMTTLSVLHGDELIRREFPSLITAIEGISSPQIINMGTAGGDLCQRPRCWYFRQGFGLLGQYEQKALIPEGDNRYHAIFGNQGPAYFVSASSLAPPLIALGASVVLTGPGMKRRELACASFFRTPQKAGERETVLEPGEIVTAIMVPLRGLRNATYEVRQRQSMDWPLVTASVAFKEEGNAVRDPKIVLGHVAPVPWVSEKAAQKIEGGSLDADLAAEAGESAASGATPLSMNGYKVQLVKTAVKRALVAAAGLEG